MCLGFVHFTVPAVKGRHAPGVEYLWCFLCMTGHGLFEMERLALQLPMLSRTSALLHLACGAASHAGGVRLD